MNADPPVSVTSHVSSDPTNVAHGLRRVAITTIAVGSFVSGLSPARLSQGWKTGPLPLELHQDGMGAIKADRGTRATYLDHHLVDTVLGAENSTWRAYRWLAVSEADQPPGSRIWAAEILRLPAFPSPGADERAGGGLFPEASEHLAEYAVVLHASIDPSSLAIGDIFASVRRIVPAAVRGVPELHGLLPLQDRRVPDSFRLAMFTTADGTVPVLPGVISDANRTKHWMFSAASGTLPRAWRVAGVPDFESDDTVLDNELPSDAIVAPSADWRAGVLRTGVGFVGLRADTGLTAAAHPWFEGRPAASNGEFFDAAELHVRTIYTDILLLGILQWFGLRQLREIAARTGKMPDHSGQELIASQQHDTARARLLDAELERFRERFWWIDASRGGVGDHLLRAFQFQRSLPELFAQLETDAESIANRVHTTSDRRRAGALAGLSILGLLGVLLGIGRIFMPSSPSLAQQFIGVGVVLLVFAIVVVVVAFRAPDLFHSVLEAYGLRRQRKSK